jgi:hypothetical protein
MGMGTGGIPPVPNIPEKTEKLGCPTDNIPETTDFLKHLILSYSFEMTNARFIYLMFYFKIMLLSHNNVVFIIKSKSKIFINSLKSAYISYILIDTLL